MTDKEACAMIEGIIAGVVLAILPFDVFYVFPIFGFFLVAEFLYHKTDWEGKA